MDGKNTHAFARQTELEPSRTLIPPSQATAPAIAIDDVAHVVLPRHEVGYKLYSSVLLIDSGSSSLCVLKGKLDTTMPASAVTEDSGDDVNGTPEVPSVSPKPPLQRP